MDAYEYDSALKNVIPECKVTFTHERVVKPKRRKDRMPGKRDLVTYSRKTHVEKGIQSARTFGGRTICTLKEKETGKVLAQGAAWCSMGDCFEYETGRKIALQRAMQNYLRRNEP